MIHIKTLRLRDPLFAGSLSVTSRDADISYETGQEFVVVRRKLEPRAEYFVPLSSVVFMEPLREEAPKAAPTADPVFTVRIPGDDVVRMVRINGKIVERKGEKKQDELDALEYSNMEADYKKKKKPSSIAEMLAESKTEEASDE